jgi:hypothetical protein
VHLFVFVFVFVFVSDFVFVSTGSVRRLDKEARLSAAAVTRAEEDVREKKIHRRAAEMAEAATSYESALWLERG